MFVLHERNNMQRKNRIGSVTISILLLLASAYTSCYAYGNDPTTHPSLRLKYEEVSFKDSRGRVISLHQLKGKVVLINFWATWCPPCLAEIPSLDKLYKDFQGNSRIIFLSVDVDGNLKSSEKFLKKRKYSLPVYQLNSALPKDLRTTSIPTTIIIDKAGKLVNKHVGGMNFGSAKFQKALRQLTEE